MPRATANPPSPWQAVQIEWDGEAPPAKLRVHYEQARTALSENSSPDVPFRFSVNPYRGCYHGCIYCYARPTHQYLDFGAGTDFERHIVVKTNVAECLRAAFERPSWSGERIVFSGNTDCYQPLEAALGLTRACLEICQEYCQPVSVITKGSVIRRDVPLLQKLAARAQVSVILSIPCASDEVARKLEPWASPPSRRFETLRQLSEAGIATGISLAPVIPGLTDTDVHEVLQRAHAAGARFAAMSLLRLPSEVDAVFWPQLEAALPGRTARVRRGLTELRRGRTSDARFGHRMRGAGPRWEAYEQLFHSLCHKLGLDLGPEGEPERSTFRRPSPQLSLFE